MTEIGRYAFHGCRSLTGELKIPDSVTTIGSDAFAYCSGLTSLTIGNDVTSIPEKAFYNCSGLTTVVIGNSVTTIEDEAFERCSELENLYSLNSEPPTCGSSVFYSVKISACTLYVPKGAKEAYASADTWKNFYEIIEILPIDEIYEKLSEEISSTKDFFEETWTSITEDYPDVVDEFREEYNALINELTQLLEQLKEYFENDELDYDKAIQIRSELEELTKKIEDLVEKAIKANWSYDFFVDGIYYNRLSSSSLMVEAMYAETNSPYSGMVIIPATVQYNGDTYTVSTIAETPFSYINGIESITIPSSISNIGQRSFSNCTNITNVICEWENPSNVSVSESSFNGVYSTATLYVPLGTSETYQSLAPWSLFSSIEEYDPVDGRIKYNITNGGATIASYQSTDLEGNITIPENVISEGANFKVIEVGNYAFNECRNIINVSLPDCVTKIGDYAFRECNNMENTPIPNSVTYIGTGAFEGCYSITSAVIPYGINEIRASEFYYCTSLADVSIPETVSTINGSAFGYCAFTNITIPEAVTYIGDHTFEFCPNLSEITIPNKVTTLDIGAIRHCTSLKEVTLGESVKTLGDYVFVGCENLEKITSYNPEPPTCGKNVFLDVDTQTCILYVPKGAKEAYASADTWEDFYNIEEKDFVTENLHNDLLNDIETVQETLEFSWNVITTDYSDVADEFESVYASLVEELKKLLEELEEAYNNGTLDETLAEEIRAKLEEIRQQIEELLEAAKNAHDALDGIESINIYSSRVQGIYTIDGKVVDAPQRGVNIVKFSDGSTKKVLVK